MKAIKKSVSIIIVVLIYLPALAQSKYDDGKGAFATGKYENLFLQEGHTDNEVNTKIETAFNQLFFGDPDTQAIYFPVGVNKNGPLAYISDVAHNDIRTEGMSYGMMIAVQLNKREVFNALWNYAMSYMYISSKSHPAEGYFSWSLKRNGIANEETPAPDGEEYFVTALYFASGRWGNEHGIYNYHQWADKILSNMRHHPLKSGDTKFGPRNIASMVNENKKMIRFVPGVEGGNFSDPSYHLPHFYELWARWGPKEDRDFWYAAADSSRKYFVKVTNPETGLAPDYATFDGKPFSTKWNKHGEHFSFDAWRTASNWSVDWLWFKKAPAEQLLSNRIQSFFASKGLDTYGCQFTLDGTQQLDNRHANGLIATNAVASVAATNPLSKKFVDALWDAPVPHVLVERYYDGLLYLMSFLHCSGQYKIYPPK